LKRGAIGAIGFGCALLLTGAAPPPETPVDTTLLVADDPAPTLDRYHLFRDSAAREPNAALVPYTLNTPLFSDYALKFRYLFVPPGQTVSFREQGALDFPVGTALVKTFAYPADFRAPGQQLRFIETRLLIHKPQGWVALTYVWNDAQNQAVLKRAGVRVPVSFVDASGAEQRIDYQVPNVNQCKECHSLSGAIVPIGPKARNLNREYVYVDGAQNQLTRWARLGILQDAPDPLTLAQLPRWDDAAQPIDARARAYLDVNCGHCHSRAGLASNSGLYLAYEESDPTALGIGKRPVAAGRGSGDLLFSIVPGHPDQSILVYRMASTEPGVMMPQIGRTLSHKEAVALISDYISSLKPVPARN
jgi:uncharacterized repeat protein (TIGR03806 family)